MTKGRADPALANVLVDNSRSAIQWLVDNGARFMLSFNRQAFEVDGKFKFWGGMVMNMIGSSLTLASSHNHSLIRPQAKAKSCSSGTLRSLMPMVCRSTMTAQPLKSSLMS